MARCSFEPLYFGGKRTDAAFRRQHPAEAEIPMSIRRIFVLFRKEIKLSASNFLFVFALIIPIVLSLMVTLIFGDLFADEPRIGLIDPGSTSFAAYLEEQPQLKVTRYPALELLKADIEAGKIETGIVLPEHFDEILLSGVNHTIEVYLWGETPFKHRLITDTAVANAAAEIAGLDQTIQVRIVQLGQKEIKSLADQFLPVLILMTIILGGVMVPAISLIEEKQKRTLLAVATTPARLWEIFTAKAMMGIAVGMVTALITLLINGVVERTPLLLLVLFSSALTASLLGILLGSMLKDLNVLLAVLKSGGILLIAPAIIDFIPQAPEWIARLFPTFYLLNPVIDVAVRSAGLRDISGNLLIQVVFVMGLLSMIKYSINRQLKSAALI
jgi:ABC-2 type transport system permease protein